MFRRRAVLLPSGCFAPVLLILSCANDPSTDTLLNGPGVTSAVGGASAGGSATSGGQGGHATNPSEGGHGQTLPAGGAGGGVQPPVGGLHVGGTGGTTEPTFCEPGTKEACYEGPMGTENVGYCAAGVRTCNEDGTAFGPCLGQSLPMFEICANGVDEDCNGVVDDVMDIDGDGWTACDGDCCETAGITCTEPFLVNPGAFEFIGNQVDDDCDPTTPDDKPAGTCSSKERFTDVTAEHLVKAMDLCQFTASSAPLAEKKWGVLGSGYFLPDGKEVTSGTLEYAAIRNSQSAVLKNFGGSVSPKRGSTMAALSTGMARDENDPGWVEPVKGTNFKSAFKFPLQSDPSTLFKKYLTNHGGALPSSSSCMGTCPAGTGAYDFVDTRVRVRTPTNAKSFSFQFKFYTGEYKDSTCKIFNDFFLVLMGSGASGVPSDKNISFDGEGNPMSVNNGFFDICKPKGCYTCPGGSAELTGTGFGYGGATKWLTTTAPLVPGETLSLDFIIFDVSNGIYDSLVLFDNFRWDIEASEVGTHE